MDIQLKRGLIEICVLKALCKSDSYGYQLIRDLEPVMEMSESTLYPILKRLETSNLLTVYTVEHNSRLRKYYRISTQGIERITEFIEEWKDVTRIYNFIVAKENSND